VADFICGYPRARIFLSSLFTTGPIPNNELPTIPKN